MITADVGRPADPARRLTLLLALALAAGPLQAGPLSVSNSKGFSSNPVVDHAGTLLSSIDPVIVTVGTFASAPAAAIPDTGETVYDTTWGALLSEFTPYGSETTLLPSAAPLNQQGVFSFQDNAPVSSTPLEGKPVYVVFAHGGTLATATEVCVVKTSATFQASDDGDPLPKLVGLGTGLGSVVIIGATNRFTASASSLDSTPDPAYSLAEVVAGGSAPTDLDLVPPVVAENLPSGNGVGTLSATDADSGDTFTYSLVGGAGDTHNGLFTISGDQLLTAATFDQEALPMATIRVRVVDSFALVYEESLMVTILDDRTEDADGDGLTEEDEEDIYGTSDDDTDSDDDGHGDGYEVYYGFDPASDLDGAGDRDGDGTPDWLEVRLGTDADVRGPGLLFTVYPNGAGDPVVLVGPGGNDLGFAVERSVDMAAAWQEVKDYPVGLAFGVTEEFVDPSPLPDQGFYRVRAFALPPP